MTEFSFLGELSLEGFTMNLSEVNKVQICTFKGTAPGTSCCNLAKRKDLYTFFSPRVTDKYFLPD